VSSAFTFGILVNGCEYGDELAGFVEQAGHVRRRKATAVHEEFEPVLVSSISLRQSPIWEMNSALERPRDASR